jgi:hypothetical protein
MTATVPRPKKGDMTLYVQRHEDPDPEPPDDDEDLAGGWDR